MLDVIPDTSVAKEDPASGKELLGLATTFDDEVMSRIEVTSGEARFAVVLPTGVLRSASTSEVDETRLSKAIAGEISIEVGFTASTGAGVDVVTR